MNAPNMRAGNARARVDLFTAQIALRQHRRATKEFFVETGQAFPIFGD
jgi:hypothetical protein